jgi:hypothetical protein
MMLQLVFARKKEIEKIIILKIYLNEFVIINNEKLSKLWLGCFATNFKTLVF